MTYAEEMRELRRQVVQRRLDEAGGNVRLAAKLAGKNRTVFYKLMASAGITREQVRRDGNSAWRELQ